MNWKGYGRKWSWANLGYYPRICLEGLRKTTKSCQDSQSLDQDLNLGPPKYEAEVLTTQPRCLVSKSYKDKTAKYCHVLTEVSHIKFHGNLDLKLNDATNR
jgi:hypothetical protein